MAGGRTAGQPEWSLACLMCMSADYAYVLAGRQSLLYLTSYLVDPGGKSRLLALYLLLHIGAGDKQLKWINTR